MKEFNGIVIVLVLAAMLVLLSGCAAPGRTAEEVHRDHVHKFKTDSKQIVDDFDDFMHWDRPSRLSDKYVR